MVNKAIYFFYGLFLFTLMCSCQSSLSTQFIKLKPETFRTYIAENYEQLIDVRTAKEFKDNHINAAKNFDYFSQHFKDSLRLLNVNKPVYIYCHSGNRSTKSVSTFKALGFKKIYELEGGISNWIKKGFKVVKH